MEPKEKSTGMQIFAQRLREYRVAQKKTQKELALEVGIAGATLSAYENGSKTPALDIALRISKALQVSLEWLCGGETPDDDFSIETYADVLKFFVQFSDAMRDEIRVGYTLKSSDELVPDLIAEEDLDGFLEYDSSGNTIYGKARLSSLEIVDYTIAGFFKDWQPVLKLYREGTIDEEMYRAWIDKRINEQKDKKVPRAALKERNQWLTSIGDEE